MLSLKSVFLIRQMVLIFILIVVLPSTRCKGDNASSERAKSYLQEHFRNMLIPQAIQQPAREQTVEQFAEHDLCRNVSGRLTFYRALERHFHKISDEMKISFILDACLRKDNMLSMWIKEMFDTDGNGHISQFEKDLYR